MNQNYKFIVKIELIKIKMTKIICIQELMIATVDNPSNGVEWALAEMLNQPETLKRAMAELDRVVGKERLVQESDIS